MSEVNIQNIHKWCGVLNGYLTAISHLNDNVGFRHGFFAELIPTNSEDSGATIKGYLNDPDFKQRKIGLREEQKIIEKYVMHNFLFGQEGIDSKNISFIKEQFTWHIQEYLSFIEIDTPEMGKWEYSKASEKDETTLIFTNYGSWILVMNFHFRIEKCT